MLTFVVLLDMLGIVAPKGDDLIEGGAHQLTSDDSTSTTDRTFHKIVSFGSTWLIGVSGFVSGFLLFGCSFSMITAHSPLGRKQSKTMR